MDFNEEVAKSLNLDFHGEQMSKAATPTTTSVFSSTGGLSQDLAEQFIDLVVDESVLLKAVKVKKTNSSSGELSLIDVTGPVTRKATEDSTSTETRTVRNTKVPFVVVKTRSDFDITGEVDEDTIEGASGSATILNSLVKAIMNDMELLSIQGDDSLGGSDDLSSLLKSNDGWNVKTTLADGAHIRSAGGARPSLVLLRRMLGDMPTKWRRNLNELRWIMSPNTVLDLIGEIEGRKTALGDEAVQGTPAIRIHGVPILEIPLMPENLSVSGTDSTGTLIWLTNPKNFVVVIARELKIHQDYQPRAGDVTEISAFMRTDFVVEIPDAVVKATNVVLDPAVNRFTT